MVIDKNKDKTMTPDDIAFLKKHSNLDSGAQSVFKNFERDERDYFKSLNGTFADELKSFVTLQANEKNNFWEKAEIKVEPPITTPEPIIASITKSDPVKTSIKLNDPTQRRVLMHLLNVVFGVAIEKGSLETMLAKAKEVHRARCKLCSESLNGILGSDTPARSSVESHGSVRALRNLFGLISNDIGIGSDELNALIALWAMQYQKTYITTTIEMSNADRKEKLGLKETSLVDEVSQKMAEFGGYESSDQLKPEVKNALPNVLDYVYEELLNVH